MKQIKILFISQRDLLKARSDAIHYMATCNGFLKAGMEVEIVAPYYDRPENIAEADIFDNYGIDRTDAFKVTHLHTKLKDDSHPWIVRLNRLFFFGLDAVKRLLLDREYRAFQFYVVYSRCYTSFFPFYLIKKIFRLKNVIMVFDADIFSGRRLEKFVLRRFSLIVVRNALLKEDIERKLGWNEKKILAPPCGVGDYFSDRMDVSREEARKKTGIPLDAFVVVYSGKVYIGPPSEIQMIIEAAKKVPEALFVFLGGKPEAVDHFEKIAEKSMLTNIVFKGFLKSPGDTFIYLRAADALVSFYPHNVPTIKYMVPTKIIDYVRSRRLIVSARYPAIEQMVGTNGAFFVEPENIEELVLAIKKVKAGEIDNESFIKNAAKRLLPQTYLKRGEAIKAFIVNSVSS